MLGNLLLGLLLAALLMASISFLGLIHLPIYILQALFKAKSDPKFLKKILLTYPLIFTATFFLLHSTSYALSACLIVLLIKSIATLVSILILPAQVKYAADSTPYGKSFLQFLYNYKYILIITTCFAAITFHALPFCICSGIISSIYIYMLCTAAAADQETIIDSSIEISSTQENSNICIYVPGNLFPYGTASEITTPFQMQEVRFPNTDHPTRCSEVAATLEDCLQAYRKVRSEAVTANNQVIAYGKSLGGMIIAMAESDLAMDKQLPIFTNCSPNTIAAIVACWLVALKAPQKTSSSFGYWIPTQNLYCHFYPFPMALRMA